VKILVVDDNEAICSGLCELLERANPNYNCESASDGNEALIKARASKPDLVILDLSMPGMGGLSSARLISHRLPGTKILLHTAHSNDMLEANASRYGVFRIVDKTDGTNLLAIIREIDSNPEEN
jgi:CheY-like chemotaxis protein